ncbi:MAG: polyprenyl synthetase family protein [Candidatus Saccharibacteria bacterium]|nr:MAG: polyprenyl synthetase family protein [Candidatus Saccharibacteria bacterium]
MTAPSNLTGDPTMMLVEASLRTVLTKGIQDATEIDSRYERLWQSIADIVSSGGKRLRPRMVLLAYEALGGRQPQTLAPVAAAHELLHTSLLIHDDIIDRDTSRRGRKNINGLYEAFYQPYHLDQKDRVHYSYSAAILAGDLLLAAAHQLVIESSLNPRQKTTAMRFFSRGIFEVAGGELVDIESTFMPPESSSAIMIARYKTASYSFISPLLSGAALAGASSAQLDHLRLFAESLGVAFQLSDDLLGMFGDEKITGKSTDSDIREGKLTYLIEQYLALTPLESRATFTAAFHNTNASPEDTEALKRDIERSGAREKTMLEIESRAKIAEESLDKLALSKSSHDKFLALIHAAVQRQK